MAAYIHGTAFEDFGPEVVQQAKAVILYTSAWRCAAAVTIELNDGRTIVREAEQYTFSPIVPVERLAAAAEGFLSREQTARLYEAVMRLDHAETVAPLMTCLTLTSQRELQR